jgi:hypothetical protein
MTSVISDDISASEKSASDSSAYELGTVSFFCWTLGISVLFSFFAKMVELAGF